MASELVPEAEMLNPSKMADLSSHKQSTDSRRWQYITTIVVNITSLINGIGLGWTSPVLPLLQSYSNPVDTLPMSDSSVSWLGSMMAVGALVSTPINGILSKHCSRKFMGYVVGLYGILSWTLILFAQSEIMLLFGRFFLGFVSSGNSILCPIYIAETVDDDIRGSLGAFLSMFICGGIVFSYVFGSYLPYTTFNIICLVVPVLYLVAFWWMPESPVYLEIKGRHAEARKVRESLNLRCNPNPGLSNSENKINLHTESSFLSEVMHNRGTRMGLIIGLGVMACNQFSGVIAVINYTVTIFKESGSEMSPNVATILVGTLQVVGVYGTSFLVDRLGRKILLVASCIIAAACLGALSLYFYLRSKDVDVTGFAWVPVTSLCIYMIGVAIGTGSLPFIIIGEIFSPHVKSFAVTLCISMGNVASFIVARFFISLTKALGMSGCYLLFTCSCLLSAVFCHFVVLETKNKSLDTILKELNGEYVPNETSKESTMV